MRVRQVWGQEGVWSSCRAECVGNLGVDGVGGEDDSILSHKQEQAG